MTDSERTAKINEQTRLSAENSFRYLGTGPAATGPGLGWTMSVDLYLKCVNCGYMVVADPHAYDGCYCGALYNAGDDVRVGSRLGDAMIEVYRARPKHLIRRLAPWLRIGLVIALIGVFASTLSYISYWDNPPSNPGGPPIIICVLVVLWAQSGGSLAFSRGMWYRAWRTCALAGLPIGKRR